MQKIPFNTMMKIEGHCKWHLIVNFKEAMKIVPNKFYFCFFTGCYFPSFFQILCFCFPFVFYFPDSRQKSSLIFHSSFDLMMVSEFSQAPTLFFRLPFHHVFAWYVWREQDSSNMIYHMGIWSFSIEFSVES